MDLVQNLLIKLKKLSMDLVHYRGSMDPVHESGPWTRSKEGVHGPLVHVLSSPGAINNLSLLQKSSNNFRLLLKKPSFYIRSIDHS